MSVYGAFRFHGVGQGLFYSGILRKKVGNKTHYFSFVYDCGSLSNREFLKREIDDFKLLLPEKKLDLLVISHLHDDHVNGLEMLLKGIEVETVVMPYTHDGLLLLAQLESNNSEEFLRDFYAAPTDWLMKNGVQRVVLLGASVEKMEQSIRNEGFSLGESRNLFVECDRFAFDDDNEVVYTNNEAKLNCGVVDWLFQFENQKLDQRVFRSYLEVVNVFKDKRCLTLEQIMKSNQLRRELRKKIREKVGYAYSMNRTSVVMYHAPGKPINRKHSETIIISDPYHWWRRFDECETILTGDIDSYNETNNETDLLPKILSEKHASIMQYPHHGASSRLGLFDSEITVLSYGLTNKYGHPDFKLKEMYDTVSVTERASFDYEIFCDN